MKNGFIKVYSIYALVCFVLLMLMIFPLVMIALLFGKIRGGNIIYVICNIWARLWYGLIGVRHEEIFLAPHNPNKQYIFVANHCSYMDIPPIVRTMKQPVRVLGKAETGKIPIFGWIYNAAVIAVSRENAANRAKSVRALKAAIANGISIFIFPEGTFNTTTEPLKDFYDGAFKIAIETQTPIKPILLLDTHKRLHHSKLLSLTPGKSRVLYLDEVDVSHYSMSDMNTLKQKVHDLMYNKLLEWQKHS